MGGIIAAARGVGEGDAAACGIWSVSAARISGGSVRGGRGTRVARLKAYVGVGVYARKLACACV